MKLGHVCITMIVLLLNLSACTVSQLDATHHTPTTIRIGILKPIENTFLVSSHWHSTRFIAQAVHRGLVSEDEQGNLVPMLAESVPTFENGEARWVPAGRSGEKQLAVTFHLREGLQWSDGQPITSRDVEFTYDLLQQNDFLFSPVARSIDRINTIDARTIVITYRPGFKNPHYNQPLGEALYPAHVLANLTIEQIEASQYALRPVGAGPYRVSEWRYVGDPREILSPGVVSVLPDELAPATQIITLETNPYFKPPPKIGQITIKVIPNENALVTSLYQGDIDLIAEGSLSELPNADLELLVNEGFILERKPSLRWERLDFNCLREPFSDVLVRKAVANAIDREAIARAACGQEEAVMQSWVSSSSWAYTPVLLGYRYDSHHAIELLEEAGYAIEKEGPARRKGESLYIKMCVAVGDKRRQHVATLIENYLEAAGFEVSIEMVHPALLFSSPGPLLEHNYDLALFSWQGEGEPDGVELWHSDSVPKAENDWWGDNFSGWSNPRSDSVLERAVSLGLQEERQKWYTVQQQIYAEDLPSVPLCEYPRFAVRTPQIQGFRLPKGSTPSTWNIEEWQMLSP